MTVDLFLRAARCRNALLAHRESSGCSAPRSGTPVTLRLRRTRSHVTGCHYGYVERWHSNDDGFGFWGYTRPSMPSPSHRQPSGCIAPRVRGR